MIDVPAVKEDALERLTEGRSAGRRPGTRIPSKTHAPSRPTVESPSGLNRRSPLEIRKQRLGPVAAHEVHAGHRPESPGGISAKPHPEKTRQASMRGWPSASVKKFVSLEPGGLVLPMPLITFRIRRRPHDQAAFTARGSCQEACRLRASLGCGPSVSVPGLLDTEGFRSSRDATDRSSGSTVAISQSTPITHGSSRRSGRSPAFAGTRPATRRCGRSSRPRPSSRSPA